VRVKMQSMKIIVRNNSVGHLRPAGLRILIDARRVR
jgi:hypothetical protein